MRGLSPAVELGKPMGDQGGRRPGQASPANPEPPKEPGQPPEPESVQVIKGAYRERVRFREGGKIRFSGVSAKEPATQPASQPGESIIVV